MNDTLLNRGFTGFFTSGALTATGAETVHDTTVTLTGALDGKILTKTAITDGTTPTTDHNTGAAITLVANQARVVVWALNASGTVKCMAGPVVTQSGGAYLNDAPQFPPIPSDVVPFAYQVIEAGSTTSGTWTFGSSNWNATGISSTIVNVSQLPTRPVYP